jgi:dihydroxy-acid dehydratase
MAEAHPFDGLALVTNCDKITPGMMMAMLRLNVPAIIISGGPMLTGDWRGQKVNLISVFEGIGQVKTGNISEAELNEIENESCPTCGSCSGMFTANSMNCLSEALGLALPGNGTIPAISAARTRLAKIAGAQVMRLVEMDLKPRDIATLSAFKNAIAVDMALGCSTNTVLHVPAIANEAGIALPLDLFNEISSKTPHLCSMIPGGPHSLQELDLAGGIQAIIKELDKLKIIDTSIKTVTTFTVGENIEHSEIKNSEVIHSVDNPYHEEGGIAILYGNLAPEGAVVKQSAVAKQMLKHSGPARVFNSEDEAYDSILNNKIKAGDIIVIRYEGPKGGPGMPEMLSPTSAVVGMGLDRDVALITDGRFSGGTKGAAIGHISPEAAGGGTIGLVKEGDIIEIDIPARSLNLQVTDEELELRRRNWKPPEPRITEGYLARYARQVSSASKGAIVK